MSRTKRDLTELLMSNSNQKPEPEKPGFSVKARDDHPGLSVFYDPDRDILNIDGVEWACVMFRREAQRQNKLRARR